MTRCTWTKIYPAALEFRTDRVHATEFGDSYFQPIKDHGEDAASTRPPSVLQEANYTFIEGNRLWSRWQEQSREQFCIAEMGLGTGANLAATLDFWLRSTSRPNRLDYLTFEARPLSIDQFHQAHALQGSACAPLTQALAGDPLYPLPGVTRYQLGPGFWLTMVLGDVENTLNWFEENLVDAWFLDGFAPSRNQAMWNEQTLGHFGRMARPGGTFATFTAASAVRRGLEAAGFDVGKTPGFGPKRERLVGQLPGGWTEREIAQRLTIAGAGIMGCWAAKTAANAGFDVNLFDPTGKLRGPGSGVPVPVIDWRPTLDFLAQGRLAYTSFVWASRAYQTHFPNACTPGPLTQLEERIWPTFAHWGYPAPELIQAQGWNIKAHDLNGVLQLNPAKLFDDVDVLPQAKTEGVSLWAIGHTGAQTNSTIRGQQSQFPANGPLPSRALKAGKLAGATAHGALFLGTSFDRNHDENWSETFDQDDADAWIQFQGANALPHVNRQAHIQWAGLRAVSVDRLPNYIMGSDGVVSINCLGSHGFTFAPLLAEQWVSDLVGAPNVVDRELLNTMGRGTRNAS